MGLRNVLEHMRRKNQIVKEIELEDSAHVKIEQKKLSANERALNKILNRKREEAIKKELDKYQKREEKEYWHKDIIAQPNIFNNQKKLFAIKDMRIK